MLGEGDSWRQMKDAWGTALLLIGAFLIRYSSVCTPENLSGAAHLPVRWTKSELESTGRREKRKRAGANTKLPKSTELGPSREVNIYLRNQDIPFLCGRRKFARKFMEDYWIIPWATWVHPNRCILFPSDFFYFHFLSFYVQVTQALPFPEDSLPNFCILHVSFPLCLQLARTALILDLSNLIILGEVSGRGVWITYFLWRLQH